MFVFNAIVVLKKGSSIKYMILFTANKSSFVNNYT